jgi:hypothetical protein
MRIGSALSGIAAVFAMGVAMSDVSYADTFTFTSCHISGSACEGGSVPSGFGTVTLTQSGTSVVFDVTLAGANRFVETGASTGNLFLFNDTIAGSTITGVTTTLNGTTTTLSASGSTNQAPIMTGGAGTFTASIFCTTASQCNGGSTPTINDLHFTVTNATIAALTTLNSFNNIFAADIMCGAGQTGCTAGLTGVVDVSSASAVPIPGALPLFASGIAGLVLLGRRKRKQIAASA